MIIATTIAEVRAQVKEWRRQGLTIGLVPTMGYLHEGHLSLLLSAGAQCDRTVASVFVNPTQFGPNEDFAAYPRDFKRDCALLEGAGCAMVFHPEADELYPEGFCTYVENASDMAKVLCGRTRPIHFRGVCTVVSKLFHIVTPDKAFFGQKDAQQLAIIRRMVLDLSMEVEVVGCPIVRESDGLAKSSRNIYLNPQERQAALCLSRAVHEGKRLAAAGERNTWKILADMTAMIQAEPLARIEYVTAVDAETLMPVERLSGSVLVAMAVYIGKTRLIDNFIWEGKVE